MNFVVRLKKSKIGTFHVLCVICSTFPLTPFSPTSPIPHLTIQNIFPIKSAILSIESMAGNILGILGAGGNTGRSILMLGMNDGGSGRVGGSGITGMVGNDMFLNAATSRFIFRSTSTVGGSGRFGSCGSGILMGTKFIFGKTIFIPSSIWERSIYTFGILNAGIGNIGSFGQRNDRLHENEP